ncbi:MAG: hypothetical protein ACP5UV_02320, partial [Thermoplasmata archaeon]
MKLKSRVIVFLSISTMATAIEVSGFYVIVSKTVNTYLFLIPIDAAFLALPAYIYFKNHYGSYKRVFNPSKEYTARLENLISGKESYIPEVGTAIFMASRNYAHATDGASWKILVDQSAALDLSDSELDACLLQAYYFRKLNIGMKEILMFFGMPAFFIDILLELGIMANHLPSS